MVKHAKPRCLVLVALAALPLFVPVQAWAEGAAGPYATRQNWCEALGERYRLLDTYVDGDAALRRAEADDPELAGHVRDAGLLGLTPEGADALKSYLNSLDMSPSVMSELRFVDMYENPYENAGIEGGLAELEDAASSDPSNLKEYRRSVRYLLPSLPENRGPAALDIYDPGVGIDPDAEPPYPSPVNQIDVRGAGEYVVAHCGVNELCEPNPDYVDRGNDHDCTNFASQIIHEGGGVPMVDGFRHAWPVGNKTGWWADKTNEMSCDKKGEQSWGWSNANNFKNYMNWRYCTRCYSKLKKHAKHGDFVSIDWGGDGTSDHTVYVLAVGIEEDADGEPAKNDDGKYIRSLTIAQHSSEHCPRNLGLDEGLVKALQTYKGQTKFYLLGDPPEGSSEVDDSSQDESKDLEGEKLQNIRLGFWEEQE